MSEASREELEERLRDREETICVLRAEKDELKDALTAAEADVGTLRLRAKLDGKRLSNLVCRCVTLNTMQTRFQHLAHYNESAFRAMVGRESILQQYRQFSTLDADVQEQLSQLLKQPVVVCPECGTIQTKRGNTGLRVCDDCMKKLPWPWSKEGEPTDE